MFRRLAIALPVAALVAGGTTACASKKFFVARCPGSAMASTPTQPRSTQNAMTSAIIVSPMLTSRAPGSTKRSVSTPSRSPERRVSTMTAA